MRLLLDTNVVLDVLLAREPHAGPAAAVLSAVETGRVTGLVGATTVTTIHYLASKAVGPRRARRLVGTLLSLCEVAPVDEDVLKDALALEFPDFEDAVLHEAARRARAKGIVTRDHQGFRRATLPVYSPTELLASLRVAE
ncbi:MAG: PIN domain-containing protein [Gemmatimonadota bacterium]